MSLKENPTLEGEDNRGIKRTIGEDIPIPLRHADGSFCLMLYLIIPRPFVFQPSLERNGKGRRKKKRDQANDARGDTHDGGEQDKEGKRD